MVGGPLHTDREDPEALDKADLRQAYERGRRDERAGRRRHPIGMTVTFILAIVGVVMLALAAAGGSFTAGGAMADQGVATATGRATPVMRQAAADAQDEVRARTGGR